MSGASGKRTNLSKLKKIIKAVDENRRPVAENIYSKLLFLDATLAELEQQIKDEGAVIELVNGNGFKTIAEHPAQKSYNTMIGRYNALIKTFIDIIPDGARQGDEFLDFVSGRSK